MSANSKASHIDSATPTIRKAKQTDADKVHVTRTTSDAVKATPDWAVATDVQSAVNIWNQVADAIDANAKVVSGLEDQLRAAVSHQAALRRDWRAATKQVLGTVHVHSKGSVDKVKALGFDVVTRPARTPIEAPSGLIVAKGKAPGEVMASWSRGKAPHGFVVQHATDPANLTTYSAVTPCTKSKFTLDGSPSGSIVHFRVAAVDSTVKSGLGPWTAWEAGTVA